MKKLLAVLLTLACLLGLSACGEQALEGPPELRLTWIDGEAPTVGGSYDWNVKTGLNANRSTIACGAHPLDCQHLLTPIETGHGSFTLEFDVEPDAITAAEYWSDEHWGDSSVPGKAASIQDGDLVLKSGGHIYQITAQWDRKEYSGTASYCFYIVQIPPVP